LKTGDAVFQKASSPQADRVATATQLHGNLLIGRAIRAGGP
jgi:hypothetical protein